MRQTELRGGGSGVRSVVSQPKLQLQLEFNVNNCLQLHLFICTPFAQLPPLHSAIPAVPCRFCCWWWWCVGAASACACAGQLATMSIGFALIRISFMHGTWPRLLFHFILFHFIPFEFFPPLWRRPRLCTTRFIMIIMFYSTIDAQIGSCLDHLQLYTRDGGSSSSRRGLREALRFRSINHVVIYSEKHI